MWSFRNRPPLPLAYPDDLRRSAAALLLEPKRWQSGERDGVPYRFTAPSLRFYYPPFQWFWDSCFHAIALAALGETDRAKEEVETLLRAQREDGFIPHVSFWDLRRVRRVPWGLAFLEARGPYLPIPGTEKPRHTELIQPPIIAQAVARIVAADDDRRFLNDVLPRLNRYYEHLLAARDPDRDSLITITSRFDGGLDWSPAYDSAEGFVGVPRSGLALWWRGLRTRLINRLRFHYDLPAMLAKGPFHVEDVAVNAILSLNLRELAKLNAIAGRREAAQRFEALGIAVRDALIANCYDGERNAFFNLTGREERRFPILTIHSLFPLILPDLPRAIADALVSQHLLNEREFWLPYPIPSVARSEPSFARPIRIGPVRFTWRDGTWVNTNWFLVQGLRQHGYTDVARHIAERTHELVQREGFAEYFDPETGKGFGAPDLGWSTLVIDM